MRQETLAAIREHAAAEYPRECCGLVVVFKGRERYWPCRNTAAKPGDQFRMHREDWPSAEDAGEIVALVHSHPDDSAKPSDADLVQCEASGVPWYIVAVHKGEPLDVRRFEPSGYLAPRVGRQVHHGILDSYTMVRDWYAREAGIVLPDFERQDDWWNDGTSSLYLDHFREAGCEIVTANIREHSEPLRRGDIILMQIRSGNDVPNHAGIFLGEGRNWFLHHLHGRLSSRDVFGGMWAECTRMVVRHRALAA
jgi:proteasome lid subunit RPN8/RPN11